MTKHHTEPSQPHQQRDNSKWADLRLRMLTILVGGPTVLLLVALGSPYLDALGYLAMVVTAIEFSGIVGISGRAHRAIVVGLFVSMYAVVIYPSIFSISTVLLGVFVVATVIAGRQQPRPFIAYPLVAAAYIGGSLGAIVLMRQNAIGLVLVATLFMTIWGTDVAALLGGRAYGRHPLAPRISPKKTIEGALTGIVVGTALGTIVMVGNGWGLWTAVIGHLAVAITTVIGDLIVSGVKRQFDVKDTGGLLPGHGGFLDRLDGAFLAALAYTVVVFLAT